MRRKQKNEPRYFAKNILLSQSKPRYNILIINGV